METIWSNRYSLCAPPPKSTNELTTYVYITDSSYSECTNAVASHEQDVMIRAFDHVVRKNRGHGRDAVVVIGNAMKVLADITEFKRESFLAYSNNMYRNPVALPQWIKDML